jgi:hypothetical protein
MEYRPPPSLKRYIPIAVLAIVLLPLWYPCVLLYVLVRSLWVRWSR